MRPSKSNIGVDQRVHAGEAVRSLEMLAIISAQANLWLCSIPILT